MRSPLPGPLNGRLAALAPWLPALLVAYFVLVGGTDASVTSTPLRALDALIGGALIVLWLRRLPRDNDALDRATLVALLAFLVAGAFSRYPRQSFDAALAATAYVAAFHLGRRAFADAATRARLVIVLAALGLAISTAFVAAWGSAWIEWGVLTRFEGWPPVDLVLPRGPYRHPHVVGMLVALLAPALLVLGRIRVRWAKAIAAAGLLAAVLVLVMSGSRTVWLAAVVASLVGITLLLQRGAPPRLFSGWVLVTAGAIAAGAVAAAWLTGAADAFVGRITDLATFGGRGRIWSAALEMWGSSPLVGTGPGSFPLELSQVGFYDGTGFTPRHADNTVIQLLAETGIAGVAGAAFTAWAFLRAALPVRSAGQALALVAVVFVAVAGLADNPTDTSNLIVLAVTWAAVATSRPPAMSAVRAARRRYRSARWIRVATAVAAGIVALAATITYLASASFDAARTRLAAGDRPGALAALHVAVTLDPGMALYRRDRGMLELVTGDAVGAERDFQAALEINPSDDTAVRGLAIIASLGDRHGQALLWARHALGLQRAELANVLLLAAIAERAGNSIAADAALSDAVRQAPWLTAGPHWTGSFPSGDRLEGVLERAGHAWAAGVRAPALTDLQPTWLAALTGRGDIADALSRDPEPLPATSRALVGAFDCDASTAEAAARDLEAALAAEGHARAHWTVRALVWRLAGRDLEETIRLARLRAPAVADALTREAWPLLPLSDGAQDYRFYRRQAVPGIDVGLTLPSAEQGLAAWLNDPYGAAARGAPASPLNACR